MDKTQEAEKPFGVSANAEKCPFCKGRGESYWSYITNDSMRKIVDGFDPCKWCNATGWWVRPEGWGRGK